MGNQSKGLIALLQFNPTVGDLAGNAQRLQEMVRLAHSHDASVCVSTELAICGYPPRDLLMQPSFIQIAQDMAKEIHVDIPVLVGTPTVPENRREQPGNGVLLIGNQAPAKVVARKQLLPTYDVFDEARYFDADDLSLIHISEPTRPY